jgi:CBS domain-containing protein
MVDLLASGQEATLSEPVTSVAKSRVITVAPTSRLSETLSRLVETERDVVVVQDEKQLLGTVSLADVVRVFRTLMRLQNIKG